MNQIFVFKTTGGEEIISYVEKETDTYYLLKDPRALVVSNIGEFQLAPVMFTAAQGKSIYLLKSAISTWSDYVRPEMEDGYRQSVSKIITPNKSILHG
jgi:hypothetical protein